MAFQKHTRELVSSRLTITERLKEGFFWLSLVVSFGTVVALKTFDAQDPTWWSIELSANPVVVNNALGRVGAAVAGTLLFCFGESGYLLPALLSICAYLRRSRRSDIEHVSQPHQIIALDLLKLFGGILLMLSSCTSCSFWRCTDELAYPAGGLLGRVTYEALLPWLGRSGVALILVLGWIWGSLFLTGISWLTEVLPFLHRWLLHGVKQICACVNWSWKILQRLQLIFTVVKEKKVSLLKGKSPIFKQSREEKVWSYSQDAKPGNTSPSRDLEKGAQPSEVEKNFSELVSPPVVSSSILSTDSIDSGLTTSSPDSFWTALSEEVKRCELDSDQLETEDKVASSSNKGTSQRDSEVLESVEEVSILDTVEMPSLSLLLSPSAQTSSFPEMELERLARLVETCLADYRVHGEVISVIPGPVIIRFELSLSPGVKASRLTSLSRDLARALSTSSVRVVEVLPGKPYVGLEVPSQKRATIYLRTILESEIFLNEDSPLSLALGVDIEGVPVVADLAKMPHLLVAGTTGSGKSVGLNAMIVSMLYKALPEQVRFIMIDPKMLELSVYEGIPHLLTNVVTDMKEASNALRWCVAEMERRYQLMSALGVRNLSGYNEYIAEIVSGARSLPASLARLMDNEEANSSLHLQGLPFIVVIVDELADLMMVAGRKVEELIARLAQKARASGIHLILATQRPSVDVITGLIKANVPTRIAFTVSSKVDSRTILDQMGAESLLGMGDMLYLAPGTGLPQRVHGAFVRDEEVHAVVADWKRRGEPNYLTNITKADPRSENGYMAAESEVDDLFDQVVGFVAETRRASISAVQRRFKIGYNRAARIIEQMEQAGMVSGPLQNGNRDVLLPKT